MERIKWPKGVNNAVMITLNMDAELFAKAYHPDANIEEADYTIPAECGLVNGLPRILDAVEAVGAKVTAFVPGWVAEHHPEAVKMLVERGHEIGCRGYAQENLGLMDDAAQEEAIQKGLKAVETVSGQKPAGFRAPLGEVTQSTFEIAKKLGFKYSSTLSDDDVPYYLDLKDGENILEIPYLFPLYDMPYFIFHFFPPIPFGQGRISSFDKVLTNWKWEYDRIYNDGACYVLQLDPTTAGDPGRIYMLDELFSYIDKKGGAWYATGSQVYDFMTK